MLPLVELIIDENEATDGIEAISLVHTPAIEENFVALSKQKVELKTLDEEKRIVVSLALIPDKEIYRRNSKGEEYNIVFSKETVRKASELYFKNLNNNNATLEHEEKTDGVSVIESWIVEDVEKDKTAIYGLNAVEGSWAVVMKIDNDEVWQDIKEGKYLGLSIEGRFSEKEAELSEVELESYSDYPQGVKSNAKKVLEWTEKNGWGSCGTGVGKQRANQLAKGEPISAKTIKRMYSYLSRHLVDLDSSKSYSDGCGKLMFDAWGGKAALRWSKSKIEKLGLSEEVEQEMQSEAEEELLNKIIEILKD
jgi:hypothetical protein